MIALKNKPNVTPPTSTYPHGRLTDDTGSGNGTPIDQQTNNDIHSFLQQLMVDAGLTPNNILDNEYDGFQLNQALGLFIQKISPPVVPYSDGVWRASNQGVYAANWGDGSQAFQFRHTRNKTCVQLQGSMLRSGTNGAEPIYTLPIGYRPSVQRLFTSFCTAAGAFATVTVATTGIISIALTATSAPDLHFDNVEFVL